jgi:CHAD domain-containing protein/CYTH domain-containing protein
MGADPITAPPVGPVSRVRLPEHLLDEPTKRGARIIALAMLDDLTDAQPRLGDPDDSEALHDFRVGLRRLRSHLRAYRKPLRGSVGRGLGRRLGKIADATGASRDGEVHLAWLSEQRATLTKRQRSGLDAVVARVQAAKREADDALRLVLDDEFVGLTDKLERRLERYTQTLFVRTVAWEQTLAATMALLVTEHAEALRTSLDEVREASDRTQAHAARIAGKRLRYLLEPITRQDPDAAGLVDELKALQDSLGNLHDTHVFSTEIASVLEHEAAGQARALSAAVLEGGESSASIRRAKRQDTRAGLLELVARLHTRGAQAFAEVREHWLSGHAAPFFAKVDGLVQRLNTHARAEMEFERKYLLNELPLAARGARPLEVDQGYLPGARLIERVRRVRENGSEHYYRTVKLGAGVAKHELEEETTPDVFSALWSLTKGRRVHKRRFVVVDGDLSWEIDEFVGRDLVVAEVELPAANTPVSPPEWLQPYVVREVTNDAAYLNVNLAR